MSDDHQAPVRRFDTGTDDIVVERTFDVERTPVEAWSQLTHLSAEHHLAPGSWWLPGFQCRATEVVAVVGHRLEVVKADQPCEGTVIVFTFEHVDTGTQIRVTQSGFDPTFVEMAGEAFWGHGRFLLDEVERFFRGGEVAGG